MRKGTRPRKKPASLVILSGGLDSTVAAAVARRDRPDHPLALLHCDYGQKARNRERQAFRKISRYFKAEHALSCRLSHLKEAGGSSLTETRHPIPDRHPRSGFTPTTYVPFRNANLLAVAVSRAEVIGADRIYLGVSEPDSSHYPDTRAAFLRAFQRAIDLGTKPDTRIRIHIPLIHLTKAEIVRLGRRVGAPFHLTWSCYRGGSRPCGRCSSCRIRRRGFTEAGIQDPLIPGKPNRKFR